MDREKTSVAMTQAVKLKLKTLALRLEREGFAPGDASVSSVVEALVNDADFETLRGYFERRYRKR